MTKNLTVGNPARLILSFAIPLIIGNMFQQFYSMADSFIVGRTLGMNALAALGCTGSINFLVLGFVMGVTQGASIITSQRFGAEDKRGIRRSFATGMLLGIAVTVILMALSITGIKPLLRLLRTPADIIEDAHSYIVVIFWGMPVMLLFNLCSNVMRAVGDSRTPLVFLVIACVINIILDYVFILAFGLGVRGAAYATVIAQALAGAACIPVIVRKLPILRITRDDWRHIDTYEFFVHAKMAIPVGFQWSIIAIGAVAVTFALNGLGATAVAAYTAGQKIDQFAGMPLNSFGAAMTTYTAQNYGARRIDRIRTGVFQGLLMAAAFSIVMGAVFIFFGRHMVALFLGDAQEAINMGATYLKVLGFFFVFLAGLYATRQPLQGLGNSLIPTLAGIMELFMRTFAAIILTDLFGFTGLCFASPLAFIGALVVCAAALGVTLKKLNRAFSL
ncbi:MAG: MATE family efflux transporter [Treponema sp.]|jgi:putative MATE family efflux protein|nr:MATE family efflux transporter [Treponema sp.]